MTMANANQAASAFLLRIDTDWAQLIEAVGPCTLSIEHERSPYESLIRAVAHQQLHTKAGDAIVQKLISQFDARFPTAKALSNAEFDTLRACGFSGRKVETIQSIAKATTEGVVPSRAQAETMTNETLISQLITLKGIGRWTVEMMLMFTLGRQDILPIDDFGVREGYKRLKQLSEPPKPKALATIGESWQPYRTIASWYLWRVPK